VPKKQSSSSVSKVVDSGTATEVKTAAPGTAQRKLAGPYADRRLIDRCLEGSEAAWERLYRRCQP